jgi:hypothetical protein
MWILAIKSVTVSFHGIYIHIDIDISVGKVCEVEVMKISYRGHEYFC